MSDITDLTVTNFETGIAKLKEAMKMTTFMKFTVYEAGMRIAEKALLDNPAITEAFINLLGKTIDIESGRTLSTKQANIFLCQIAPFQVDVTNKELAILGDNFYLKGKYFERMIKIRTEIQHTIQYGEIRRVGEIAQCDLVIKYSVSGIEQPDLVFTAVVSDPKSMSGQKVKEITLIGKINRKAHASLLSVIDNTIYPDTEDDIIDVKSTSILKKEVNEEIIQPKRVIKAEKPDYSKKEVKVQNVIDIEEMEIPDLLDTVIDIAIGDKEEGVGTIIAEPKSEAHLTAFQKAQQARLNQIKKGV